MPIVEHYARLWPREVFDVTENGALAIRDLEELQEPGVYILYKDDIPYYIGKAKSLFSRLHDHANKRTDRYFSFWNYFSAFIVPDEDQRGEVEGLLIASMTTANRSVPRIKEIKIPTKIVARLRRARRTLLNTDFDQIVADMHSLRRGQR